MKKFMILLALVMMVAMPIFAEHVTPETARKVASTFLKNNGAKANQLTDLSKTAGFPNLYIFSADEGFVVMSADDCVTPILGYSLTGKFVVEDMPENLRWWLQGYNDEIQCAIDHNMKAIPKISSTWKGLSKGDPNVGKSDTIVPALLQTKWAQRAPFNNLCPTETATGCVATAMAQIMNYHKWPQSNGIGLHSYIHPTYGELSANFYSTTYDWGNMKDNYSSNYNSSEAIAVATLLYHCGVSINMVYGTSGSDAFSTDIPSALINYFNYSNTAKYKRRYNNDSTAYWIADLKSELDARRPVEYAGAGNSGGHAFVCDGYRSDDYFHFNWGWANNADGFYTIDNLHPSNTSSTYNNEQIAVFGIQPAHCSISAPSNFIITQIEGTKNISLNWDAVIGASSYNLFRNGNLIQTIEANQELSYTDIKIPYGTSIYYIRSVDSNGEMSLSSEYKSISIQFPAPTSFQAEALSNGHVNLSWEASQNAVSYNIYCNEVQIANVLGTSYEDIRPIPTNPSYYVKAVDIYGDESSASSSASVTVAYQTPVVNNLNTSFSGEHPLLSWSEPAWCYPQTETTSLSHGNGSPYYHWPVKYYAHRHLATNLSQHVGKALYKIRTNISSIGTYTVYIYTNTVNDQPDPLALVDTKILACTSGGWRDIPLSEPIFIEANRDLWIVMKQENTTSSSPVPSFNLSTYNENACYYSNTSPTSLSNPSIEYKVSWFIIASLTDGTYTYNLYDNDTKLNGNTPISDTSYLIENCASNTIHRYVVKTNYYNGESTASNMAGLTVGTASINGDLTLDNNDKMTITENSILTVNGTLTNTNADNLIIEDGGQLITSSNNNVVATVKKSITGHEPNDLSGWKFIASPVSTAINPRDAGLITDTFGNSISDEQPASYDLYYFDESQELPWKNYRKNSFSLENGKGYLYANNETIDLAFAGTLYNGDGGVPMACHDGYLYKGWNLVGNPFICDASIDRPFFIINGRNLKASTGTIPPCTGVMVQAAAVDTVLNTIDYTQIAENVTFSKVNPSSTTSLPNQLQITVSQQVVNRDGISTLRQAQGSEAIDNAIVSFNKGNLLEKFVFNADLAKLYIPQNGKDFAIVTSEGFGEMPVNFSAAEDGTYTLTVSPEGVEMNYLHLIDNLTGNDIDLFASPDYIFEAKTTDYASRFRLVFASVCEDSDDDNENFAFINDGNIIVYKEGTLQIIDITGRIVLSGDAINRVSTSRMTPGVYVLRLITANGVKTQKIIID